MNLRDELTPFANTGSEAFSIIDRFFTKVTAALRRDQRFADVPRFEIELLLADAQQWLFNELRDRVHLDDVDFVDGEERHVN
jgi:hypothetical protein